MWTLVDIYSKDGANVRGQAWTDFKGHFKPDTKWTRFWLKITFRSA